MDIRLGARLRAFCLIILSGCAGPAASVTLVDFTFDDGSGGFTLFPHALGSGVIGATWQDDANRLTDLLGNPGRALAASGFSTGNRLHLSLAFAADLDFALERLELDVRASTSGPQSFRLEHAGTVLSLGALTSAFSHVDLALNERGRGDALVLDFIGVGATTTSGTWRLDNVRLHGSLSPVPLPGAAFLLVTPLVGLLLRGLGVAHGRAASTLRLA